MSSSSFPSRPSPSYPGISHGGDRYTALPRPRRSSQPASMSVADFRSGIRPRYRSASTANPPVASSSVPDLSKRPHQSHLPRPASSRFDSSAIHRRPPLPPPPPPPQPRHYMKPEPEIIFAEINRLLGGNSKYTPLRDGPIRDFLDVDEIYALHDRDIMDNREREDFRIWGDQNASRGLSVFGTPLRQVSMYASVHAPLHPESSTCAFDVPLVVAACISELRRRNLRSPLPFLQSKSTSRTRLLLLSQAFDSPPYSSQTISSESTPDLCALLKMYTLTLPEPIFSEAVSEGLWRWCIRPSLEEKDVAALEAREDSALSGVEDSRVRITALLLRLLPSANLGLLMHIFDFFAGLRGEEKPQDVLASYTEMGRMFGEAIFGRNSGIQKSILRNNNTTVPKNARAVSITVWILRRWFRIQPLVSGCTVETNIGGGSYGSSQEGSVPLAQTSAGKQKQKAFDPGKDDYAGDNSMVYDQRIIQDLGGPVSNVPLERTENNSGNSTQALDERLEEASVNLLDPHDDWVELPNPHTDATPVSSELGMSSSEETRGETDQTTLQTELLDAQERIKELERDLEVKHLAEASAKEKEELASARAEELEQQLAATELKFEELREGQRALQLELEQSTQKSSSLEARITELEAELEASRRDKETVEAERDSARKLVDRVRRLLTVAGSVEGVSIVHSDRI